MRGASSALQLLGVPVEEVSPMLADEKAKKRFMFCGRCAAVLSVLLFVPVVRRVRAERQAKHTHRRMPIFGH